MASIEKAKYSLSNLREIKMSEYFNPRVLANLEFIETFLKKYKGNESLLVSDSALGVVEKFDEIIEIIKEEIKKKYYNNIHERLDLYASKIMEVKDEKSQAERELEVYKQRMNEKLKLNINEYEGQMNNKITALEQKVNRMDSQSEMDPMTTFKNAFTYTSMLSILVLLLSGFASYSNSDFNEMASFSSVIRIVLVEGAQWALITFMVGTIISIFTTISTIVQKTSYKQAMVKKVSSLIDEKEKGKIQLRKETEYMLKQYEQKIKKRIELFEAEIKDMEEKQTKENDRLIKDADEKIKQELTRLESFPI